MLLEAAAAALLVVPSPTPPARLGARVGDDLGLALCLGVGLGVGVGDTGAWGRIVGCDTGASVGASEST